MCRINKAYLLISFTLLTCFVQGQTLFKVGAGYGNGFGMFGAGAEFEISNFSLLAGVGSYLTDEIAYDAGIKYYFGGANKNFRPSITVSYGPTEVHEYTISTKDSLGNNLIRTDAIIFGAVLMGGLDFKVPNINNLIMNFGLGIGSPIFGLPSKVKESYQQQDIPDLEDKFRLALGLKYLIGL